MHTYDLWMTKFGDCSPVKQVAIMVGMAALSANVLALFFYYTIGLDNPAKVAGVITCIMVLVSVPLGAFLVGLNFRLKQLADELEMESRKDGLTGLSNRVQFYLQAEKQITLCDGLKSAGAVLFIDADHFKSINDQFGHAIGDAVIQETASLIKSLIGVRDFAGRIGGEEFVVFLTDADLNKARWVAQKILAVTRRISERLQVNGPRCDRQHRYCHSRSRSIN